MHSRMPFVHWLSIGPRVGASLCMHMHVQILSSQFQLDWARVTAKGRFRKLVARQDKEVSVLGGCCDYAQIQSRLGAGFYTLFSVRLMCC